jgi:hypothetical protein
MNSKSAIPITARAAHLARRYAAAVAVVLAVAVAPGALPSQARTEILRVHHADGSISFVTTDGQTVAELPPDAVIVDQPATPPAMEAAPAPAATPTDSPKPDSARGLSDLARQARGSQPATVKRDKPRKSIDRQPTRPINQGKPATTTPAAATPTSAPATPKPHKPHKHIQATPAPAPAPTPTPTKPPPAPDSVKSLDTRAGLAVADTPALHNLSSPAPTALPDKNLQSIDELAPSQPVPSMNGVPGLFTLPQETPAPPAADHSPSSHNGNPQPHSGSRQQIPPPPHETEPSTTGTTGGTTATPNAAPPTTTTGGTFFDQLPGPAQVSGVPNFVIQRFHVPPFLLSIYQAAGIQYGIRWEVLAAINEIETDYGRNLNVSSAGALGWMQFMPSTWKMYGTDANKDGKRDPYNPVDAIFAAARYLKAAGGDKDIRKGIFAYNHAGWYVDSVMLRARLIAGYPPDLIGSLTGLTEGRFPVAARARYTDALSTKSKQVKAGQNAANVIDSSSTRRGIDIFAKHGSPVVAVNDGVVKKIGRSKSKGLYVVLQDVYGNRYTYSGLGSLSKLYPVPKADTNKHKKNFAPTAASDPKPSVAASAGTHQPGTKPAPKTKKTRVMAVKERLFAHPARPASKRHGGSDQLMQNSTDAYDNYFSKPLGLNSKNATLKRLKKGSHVVGSTVLGRVAQGHQPHIHFEIQPAGKGAPKIDPKPILDGWKLLESTAIYRAKGRNVLYGDGNFSIGEIMLLPKPLLIKRVLSDTRIKIYPAGRNDIRTGQVDRRVLIVLEYLAESGLEPTVSCLKTGHNLHTSSGNISEHSSGNAVDISAINGVSILGHQGSGDVTEQAVRRLMLLQGTVEPHQIISLLDFGRNTMALPDHANHIHVGFHPLFGANARLGRETKSVLKPGQWDTLVQRLGQIQNPTVPTQPSKYAIPDTHGQGE